MEFFATLFDTTDFTPRWTCGNWSNGHALTHIVSDFACAAAYVAIPLVMIYFILRRRDLKMPRAAQLVAWLFVLVFLCCAVVHSLEAVIFWEPYYRVSAVAKVITASISWITVIALVPLIPRVLALKSPVELEHEIAQRRKAESALRESEALYASLVESLPLNVFRKDLEGRTVFANGRLYETVGMTPDNVIGKTDYDLFPKEYAEQYSADDRRVIEHGEFIDKVEQHVVSESESTHVQVLKAPVRNAEGEITGVQGMFWDVSDRVRAEQALQQERRLLHSLLEHLPDAIYFKDRECRFIRVNPAVARMLGFDSPEEMIGKCDHDFLAKDAADAFLADEQRIMESGEPIVDKEEQQVWGDGRTMWTSTTKMPYWGPSGQIEGTFGISRDITDRKNSEIALRAHTERLQSIIENAYDAFIAMDSDGNVVDWNEQASHTFGWSREEALGQPVGDLLIPEEMRDAHRRGIANFLRTGEGPILNRRVEVQAQDRSGRRFPIELSVAPSHGQKTTLFNAFLHDITTRKQAEAELHKAKEAAESANYAKSLFLANMSHEIRTPMNGILGMTELVLDTPLNPEQREYLRMVKESGESLMTVIEDILDFSKIEAGKLDLVYTDFDIRESLGDTVRSLAFRAHGKGLELALHVQPDVPTTLVGDPRRLRQIIVNLIGNSVKFTESGEVVLDVEIRSQLDENVVLHFSVSDTGVGIPREKQATIFKAFEQADNTATRKFGGTGLGLAISSRLVELMGGRIWVESVPDRGSTFHFTSMFSRGKPRPALHAKRTRRAVEGAHVLVVDDNATNRKILEEMLCNWALRPVLASGVAEALQRIEQADREGDPYDLILTDSQMPEQDGFDLIEQIRQGKDGESTIIMMLTSGDQPGDIARCDALDVASYLVKPVKQSELFDAIVAALNILPEQESADSRSAPAPISSAPLKILLAEDSIVNQKLALGLLKKWGHDTVVANNGKEALEAYRRETFDLIIMDVQMPEMDGLEATTVIRNLEKASGRHVPILAMTAHAMKGDRQRCLDAGMDDYLSKPVRADQLQEILTRLGGRPAPAEKAAPAEPVADAEVMDWSVALAAVGGDKNLLRDVIEAYLEESPNLIRQLHASLESGDLATFTRSAHTLKGSMRYFGAERGFDLALKLETMGRSGDTADAAATLRELQTELERIGPLLESFVKSGETDSDQNIEKDDSK